MCNGKIQWDAVTIFPAKQRPSDDNLMISWTLLICSPWQCSINIMDYKFHYCFKWLTENEFIWRNGIHKIVGNKVKGWISKRVFQENKANQVFRKTIISYPLIRLDVSQIPVDTERFELEFHHQISAVRSYNKGKDFY